MSNVLDKPIEGVLRTPPENFVNLPDYPFKENFFVYNSQYRIHYLDEGPKDAQQIFLLHGEPSWSFLYRKMIPIFVKENFRVIVPDLLGCGKSDKPVKKSDYTYKLHVNIMTKLVEYLDLQNITPFYQDWGGLIGLRVVANLPDRFARVVVGNTGLPDATGLQGLLGNFFFQRRIKKIGKIDEAYFKANPGFYNWIAFSQTVDDFHVAKIVQGGVLTRFPIEVFNAYDAPFPDDRYKAGVRVFPALIPTQLRANHKAWKVFENWQKPFLLTFSDSDPITKGQDRFFKKRVPGIKEHPITNAGHFLQEDKGPELAQIMIDFINETK